MVALAAHVRNTPKRVPSEGLRIDDVCPAAPQQNPAMADMVNNFDYDSPEVREQLAGMGMTPDQVPPPQTPPPPSRPKDAALAAADPQRCKWPAGVAATQPPSSWSSANQVFRALELGPVAPHPSSGCGVCPCWRWKAVSSEFLGGLKGR